LNAASLAGGLSQQFKRGARIGIIANNGLRFTLSYLAVMRAGMVAVPINYRLPSETIAFILQDSECDAVMGHWEYENLVSSDYTFIAFEGEEFATLLRQDAIEPVVPVVGEFCEILYTSGSTGRPKGVPLDHAGQIWALEQFVEATGFDAQRSIIVAPTYHMNGLFFTTVALALGWRTYSMPRFDAKAFIELAAKQRCTLLSGIPTMLAMIAREQELLSTVDLTSVKALSIGSAPLTEALVDRVAKIFPNAELRNSYGTTEGGPAMFGPHPNGLPRPSLALGYPYPNVDLRLVDGSENEGKLLTRTPAVMKGYLNLPQVNAERLSADGWYDTGDVMRRDSEGFYYFVGRADDMFVCGGENIYPGEIEKLLERHPAILQSSVVPAEDEIKGHIPIAFVVKAPGAEITDHAVKQFALANGPAYAHPRAVVFLDALPIGGTHKVDREILKPIAADLVRSLNR
jgi:acyl-CoA synthetase (AMP-forming)/AMP-acid ligase II